MIPASLKRRIQPVMTMQQVRERIALERALRPPQTRISRDEFEQLVYDRAANSTSMDRAGISQALRANYLIEEKS